MKVQKDGYNNMQNIIQNLVTPLLIQNALMNQKVQNYNDCLNDGPHKPIKNSNLQMNLLLTIT
jgi:hypothetical protein